MKKIHYLILVGLLIGAFWVRIYRTDELLRFYYDQGRDALVVWEMIHNFKPVLVGPTTGLAGILRGPAFYYLLLPFYLIGRGDPVVAAIGLQVINVFGLYVFYLLAKKLFSPTTGLVAVFLLGFSAHMVDLSRWLSNPSPILTTVPIMLYAVVKILKENRGGWWWIILALMLGLNLQFEMASEIWFIPVVAGLTLYPLLISPFAGGERRIFPPLRRGGIGWGVFTFLATLLPQIFFDVRHDGLMRKAILSNFANQTSSSFAFSLYLIKDRLSFYNQVLNSVITPNLLAGLIVLLLFLPPILAIKEKRKKYHLPLLFLIFPLSVLLFFRGNGGNFYSYYLMGLFPLLLLVTAGIIGEYLTNKKLFWIGILGLVIFGWTNFRVIRNFLISGIDGPNSITIKNQQNNLDWIYREAKEQPFNVEVYVPPVIPYSYDYLFKWYGQKKYGFVPNGGEGKQKFLLYEVDPDHPEKLGTWLTEKTKGLTKQGEYSSGGVHSEKW